jgi:hypothetical protein
MIRALFRRLRIARGSGAALDEHAQWCGIGGAILSHDGSVL